MKKLLRMFLIVTCLVACQSKEVESKKEEPTTDKIYVYVQDKEFTLNLEENETTNQLIELLEESDISIYTSDYSGFEKVGDLSQSLVSNDTRMKTEIGDVVLYNSNKMVFFYGSNEWEYTKIGTIENLDGWKDALGQGDVLITLSLQKQ